MPDTAAVGKGDGIADLLENRQQSGQGELAQGFGFADGERGQNLGERCAFDEFHRVEKLVLLVDAHLVHRHDIRVLEHSGDARLVEKAFHAARTPRVQHDLHRDLAAHGRLARLVNGAHTAMGHHASAHVAGTLAQQVRIDVLPHAQRNRAEDGRLSVVEIRQTDRGLAVNEGSVLAVEVLNADRFLIHNKPRMRGGHARIIDVYVRRLTVAPDDVFAGGHRDVDKAPPASHEDFGRHSSWGTKRATQT